MGHFMKTFKEAWGTPFYANQLSAPDLANMMVACMCNLTGARAVTESANINPCARLSSALQPFAECVLQLQRTYHKNPDYKLAILGNSATGLPTNAIILNTLGEVVYDPLDSQLVSHTDNQFMYRYPTGTPQKYSPKLVKILAETTLLDGVKYLRSEGLWKDNSWGYDQDFARGSNYL